MYNKEELIMFDMFDDIFVESAFEDDDTNVTLTEMESGFVWADCEVEESSIDEDVDPFDFITEAMYANVINAKNIQLAIMQEKYDFLQENGYEMVTEGLSLDGIKKFFSNLWQKIKDFFDSVIAKMVELQAKFRMLFESGREKAKLGMPKITMKVPAFNCKDVEKLALRGFKDSVKEIKQGGVGDVAIIKQFDEEIKRMESEKNMKAPNFKEELDILKNYGAHIKSIKKGRNDALKAVKNVEKKALTRSGKAHDKAGTSSVYDDTHIRTDWAQNGNFIMTVSKFMCKLIMKRVNYAAKAINAAVKEGKDPYKNKKKAKNESAYISDLEMM